MNTMEKVGVFIADKINRIGQMTQLQEGYTQESGGENIEDSPLVTISVAKRSGDTVLVYEQDGTVLESSQLDAYTDDTTTASFSWRTALGSPTIAVIHDQSTYAYRVEDDVLATATDGDTLTAPTAKSVYFKIAWSGVYYAIRLFNSNKQQISYWTQNVTLSDGYLMGSIPPVGIPAYIQIEHGTSTAQTRVGENIDATKHITAEAWAAAYATCNNASNRWDITSLEDVDPITTLDLSLY